MTMKKMFINLASKLMLSFALTIMYSTMVFAQNKSNFNPEQFEAELEQFVVAQSALTPSEAATFVPIYKEMRQKQRSFFNVGKRQLCPNPNDEKACAEAIRRRDKNDLELKKIQQTYHERFMTILPATKVFRVLKAEDKFHRQFFKKVRHQDKQGKCKAKGNISKKK